MTGRILPAGLSGHTALGIGDRFHTGRILVETAAIDRFADLTGDCFALHMEDAAARALCFPRRFAHGVLVLSLIGGL